MKTLIGTIFGAVLLSLTIAMVAYSQDRKPDSDIRPFTKPFAAGSIVSITTSDSANTAVYFEEPQIKKIGDAWFVVGKYAELPGFPAGPKSLTGWVAMNSIKMINEYKDADELLKAVPAPTQTSPFTSPIIGR